MRIIDRKEFLSLPIGTLFAFYGKPIFSGMCVKGEDDQFANVIEAKGEYHSGIGCGSWMIF